MSKIMSVFEKLNIVEKVEGDSDKKVTANTDEKSENTVTEQEKEVIAEAVPDNSIELSKVDKINISSEKNMSVEEIYTKFGVKVGGVNTIFMLEKFIDALPEKLPFDVKKDSIMNILSASGADLNTLLSDGGKRLDILQKFSQEYSKSAGIAVEKYKNEIEKLNKLIKGYEEQIYVRESMLNEQNNSIKKESEKISAVIDFFKNN